MSAARARRERGTSAAWPVELAAAQFAETNAPITRPDRPNGDRLQALPRFVAFHGHGRPHTAIGGLVPRAAVTNVPGHHS